MIYFLFSIGHPVAKTETEAMTQCKWAASETETEPK